MTTTTDFEPIVFSPRPLGSGGAPCFVCGLDPGHGVQMDMASYVSSKEEGERAVELFWSRKGYAVLDYREFEPGYVQVKVGACWLHEPNLRYLQSAIVNRGNSKVKPGERATYLLTPEILDQAMPRRAKEPVEEVLIGVLGALDQSDEMLGSLFETNIARPTKAEHIIDALHKAGYEITERRG